jgi:hypothetical protein
MIKKEDEIVAPEIFVTEISPVKIERQTRKRRSTRSGLSLEEEVDCKKPNSSIVNLVDAIFLCYYCDVELFTHDEFLVHRDTHRAPGESFAIKRICNLCLTEVNDYLKHLQAEHIDYTPNVCKTCNKSFVIQNELKNHLSTHTSPKKLKCQSCPVEVRKFSLLNNYNHWPYNFTVLLNRNSKSFTTPPATAAKHTLLLSFLWWRIRDHRISYSSRTRKPFSIQEQTDVAVLQV